MNNYETCKRLFVDVDETLIHQNLYNLNDTANDNVINFVRQWHRNNPDGQIIIWSTSGWEYAKKWGKDLMPDIPQTHLSKRRITIRDTDIFIDDAPWDNWKSQCLNPKTLEYWNG